MKKYIHDKARLLHQFGLSDSESVEAYFKIKTEGMPDDKAELKIERLARDMLKNFFDGDRTFVKRESVSVGDYVCFNYFGKIKITTAENYAREIRNTKECMDFDGTMYEAVEYVKQYFIKEE